MQNLINRIHALFNYQVNSLLELNGEAAFSQLSAEKINTQDDIQMIYELEQFVYEHVDIADEHEKKNFIVHTTDIFLKMREIVYSLNSIYMCAEQQRCIFPIEIGKFERAKRILEDIEEYRIDLYECTDLKKIKGVA